MDVSRDFDMVRHIWKLKFLHSDLLSIEVVNLLPLFLEKNNIDIAFENSAVTSAFVSIRNKT